MLNCCAGVAITLDTEASDQCDGELVRFGENMVGTCGDCKD